MPKSSYTLYSADEFQHLSIDRERIDGFRRDLQHKANLSIAEAEEGPGKKNVFGMRALYFQYVVDSTDALVSPGLREQGIRREQLDVLEHLFHAKFLGELRPSKPEDMPEWLADFCRKHHVMAGIITSSEELNQFDRSIGLMGAQRIVDNIFDEYLAIQMEQEQSLILEILQNKLQQADYPERLNVSMGCLHYLEGLNHLQQHPPTLRKPFMEAEIIADKALLAHAVATTELNENNTAISQSAAIKYGNTLTAAYGYTRDVPDKPSELEQLLLKRAMYMHIRRHASELNLPHTAPGFDDL